MMKSDAGPASASLLPTRLHLREFHALTLVGIADVVKQVSFPIPARNIELHPIFTVNAWIVGMVEGHLHLPATFPLQNPPCS